MPRASQNTGTSASALPLTQLKSVTIVAIPTFLFDPVTPVLTNRSWSAVTTCTTGHPSATALSDSEGWRWGWGRTGEKAAISRRQGEARRLGWEGHSSSCPDDKCGREGQRERQRDGGRKGQLVREQPHDGSGLRRARLPVRSALVARSQKDPPSCQSLPARRPAVR
eukprot:965635-Rhodomonas_salina.4